MRSILLAVALLLIPASAQAADGQCRIGSMWVMPNSDGIATLTAPSGKRCGVMGQLQTGGGSNFRGVTIKTQPANGKATSSGTRVFYQSKPGYRGSDSFIFVIQGEHRGQPATGTVKVSITVE